MWQGLVGSPLHQVSRDVRSRGRLEAGATRAPGGVEDGREEGGLAKRGRRRVLRASKPASEQASKQAGRQVACKQVEREREKVRGE